MMHHHEKLREGTAAETNYKSAYIKCCCLMSSFLLKKTWKSSEGLFSFVIGSLLKYRVFVVEAAKKLVVD